MTLPLESLRVLDLTQVLAGPFCTMVLADLGADVVKIESPDGGDQARAVMGPRASGSDSVGFMAINRNKRSVALDLKSPSGQGLFMRLAGTADVVVENFRPGVAARLGVDHASVHAVNPGIVYASISGFGQTGPYAERPGYDLIAQAMSGIMSVTGEADGPPVKCGIPVSDLAAGLFCATSILAACLQQRMTGRGQYLDGSLFEAALALSVWEASEVWATGQVPRRLGSAHRFLAPYQAFETRDGYITIGANNQPLWRSLCSVVERPDLVDDPRFVTNDDRFRNREALQLELEATLGQRPTDVWVTRLIAAGVPAGPIRTYDEVLEDPHTLARNMVQEADDPLTGTARMLGFPVKLSEAHAGVRNPAPRLGEHTDEVLREAGLSPTDIAQLRAAGVV